jgi:hypothetical protein
VLSDYEYDMLCKRFGVEGGGGSDRASDYPEEVKQIAAQLTSNPPVKDVTGV